MRKETEIRNVIKKLEDYAYRWRWKEPATSSDLKERKKALQWVLGELETKELLGDEEPPKKPISSTVCWAFNNIVYKSYMKFRRAVIEYNEEIVEYKISDFELYHEYIKADSFRLIYHNPEWGEEFDITVYPEDGKEFLPLEILWHLHNWWAEHEVSKHHIYFEGIEWIEDKENTGYVHLGS